VITQASSGMGFLGWLALAFIVLKLAHVISWPWLWVLSPIWAPLLLLLGLVCVFGLIWGIAKLARGDRP
jgi:hypothetical protein